MLLGRAHVRICPEVNPVELRPAALPSTCAQEEDQRHLKRVLGIERREGVRYQPTCLSLAKLLIYSLYFRYETPRGLPPDTGVSFSLLPLVLSAFEGDYASSGVAWRFPSLPYKKYLPLMESARTGPSRAQQTGFWGDKSPHGIANEFEQILTEAAVTHSHSIVWGRHDAFHYVRLEFSNYFCEKGDPALIAVHSDTQLNCRPEISVFDCSQVCLTPFDATRVSDLPPGGYDFSELNLTASDILAMASRPMMLQNMKTYVQMPSPAEIEIKLKQDEDGHGREAMENLLAGLEKMVQGAVGRSMFERLRDDVINSQAKSKDAYRGSGSARLQCLTDELLAEVREGLQALGEQSLRHSLSSRTALILQRALLELAGLHEELMSTLMRDRSSVAFGVEGVELLANQFPVEVVSCALL